MSWAATAILGGAAISGATSIYGANKASSAQQDAANQAAATQMAMFQQTQRNLAPYRNFGTNAIGQLQGELPYLTSPIKMDQADLENTPGYQFQLYQGEKAAQNSYAARGLGASGAALKGGIAFASGLADKTYNTRFEQENTNRSNAYNRLMGVINAGETAAGATSTAGTLTGQGVAGSEIAGGNAAAAGYNSIGAAGTTAGNAATSYALYNGLYGNKTPTNNAGYSNGPSVGPNVFGAVDFLQRKYIEKI